MNYHQLPTKYIDQLSLNVSDIQRSIDFYSNTIGMQVLENGDRKAVMTFDGEQPILTLVQPESVNPLDRRKTGLFHVAYLVPTRSDLANAVYYFWKNQLPIQGASDHRVSEALYLADPDGNGIEIYRDREPNEWKWNNERVEMDTIPLDVNGILQERTDEGWNGFPKDSKIGHIHLQVHDIASVQPFYEALGFDVVAEYGPQALFMADQKYHHHIGMNVWNSRNGEKKLENDIGLNWYSVKMTEEDRQKAKENLSDQVSEAEGHYVVEDPAGIKVKF
ncbi:VOC family protein [Tenuibacillus multivorans]|uniref:Catechol 2,3-dioxygenase n=1 Tax=Tenuibacillus multivorans TaxID=237069 RepID=A0A1G9X053_9BACI|nr:VOC family protein [Tenuibacillus multivorans]GEL77292.1 glyoxalase [Tenuibacillus multivorans]SDM89796.1 catechol 2,3-dioxygenase [Tenuibacillus multivorans]